MTLKWAHAGLLGDEDGFFETVDNEKHIYLVIVSIQSNESLRTRYPTPLLDLIEVISPCFSTLSFYVGRLDIMHNSHYYTLYSVRGITLGSSPNSTQ